MNSRDKESTPAPLISICIANYNGEDLLDDCLTSIYKQDAAHEIEILIHDDASTDRSLDVITLRHPTVLVVKSTNNVGYCKSNNRLVEKAQGKYILLLNNDAALRPQALQALLAHADSMPEASIISLSQYDWHSKSRVDLGVRLDIFHTPFANMEPECEDLAYVQGACMFMERETWQQLGGFPDWMESNAEDLYICTLLRLRGGKISIAPGSGYDHRQGTSFGGNSIRNGRLSTTYRRRYLSERNRASLIFVCTPTVLAWALYFFQITNLALEGALLSALKRSLQPMRSIYIPAMIDSLRIFKALRNIRRNVQANTRISLWGYLRILAPVPHKIILLFKHGLPALK